MLFIRQPSQFSEYPTLNVMFIITLHTQVHTHVDSLNYDVSVIKCKVRASNTEHILTVS